MPRRLLTLHSATVAALVAAAGIAQAQSGSAPADSTVFIAVPAAAALEPVALSPLEVEVATIREAFSLRLVELTAAYRSAPDATAAAEAQRDIAALKTSLELDLLDLQLRLARERSDSEALAELEAARESAGQRLGDVRLPSESPVGAGDPEATR